MGYLDLVGARPDARAVGDVTDRAVPVGCTWPSGRRGIAPPARSRGRVIMARLESRPTAEALARMATRVEATLASDESGFPHYADQNTGVWTRSPAGDWCGGFWVGMLWLAALVTGEDRYRRAARIWVERLRPRRGSDTVYRGLLFWHGAAIGALLHGDRMAREVALEGALGLARLYNPRARLIPLGDETGAMPHAGRDEASIGGVPGTTPLLIWAGREIGDEGLEQMAVAHANRHAEICVRADGSVNQSASFDVETGELRRRYTHNGARDDSTWARAQAWAMAGFVQAARWQPPFREVVVRVSDWWVDHLPADGVAFWDFDDPEIPNTNRDTSATAIAAAALLKAARLIPEREGRYRETAERMVRALIDRHLTPAGGEDPRPPGILTDGCYDRRTGLATRNELIWGDYYLFETLCALDEHLDPVLV